MGIKELSFMLRSCLNTKYLINICDDHHVAKMEVLCLLVAKKAVQRDELTTLSFLSILKLVHHTCRNRDGMSLIIYCAICLINSEYTVSHILRTTPDIYFLLLSRSWLSSQGKVG